ncbi:MAG: hypothetical protein GX410_07895 [Elusimicrobia bacterium]|nr:hypothetical protein [Elusimicrobiota bacterium]
MRMKFGNLGRQDGGNGQRIGPYSAFVYYRKLRSRDTPFQSLSEEKRILVICSGISDAKYAESPTSRDGSQVSSLLGKVRNPAPEAQAAFQQGGGKHQTKQNYARDL